MSDKTLLNHWTANDSADLYRIRHWSAGYFNVSPEGNVIVCPDGKPSENGVSLLEIINGIRDRGLDMPVLLRIDNILASQISALHSSFSKAIKSLGYKGQYRGVFPVKVNQQQQVVEIIAQTGARFHHGLEAGSKAELFTAISAMRDTEACLICNGYKDQEFIDLGLYAISLGFNCFFVVEMPSELETIVERSKALGIKPNIGVRAKLSSKVGGHWSASGGEQSTFGLTPAQIVDMVDALREDGMLDCLKLLHYHLGSQVPNIRDIRTATMEASRIYAGLVAEGAAMGYLDLGGGLAVDYDGTRTNYVSSRNYSLDEYCADVVEAVMSTLDESDTPHPHIITESGRATVAYCSVLVFNILDVCPVECEDPATLPDLGPAPHAAILNLQETLKTLTSANLQECYNDAVYYHEELLQLFLHGKLNLRERTVGERLFWLVIKRVAELRSQAPRLPKELDNIDTLLADVYYGNFSVYQSLADSWTIDQLFPVMPVHRLGERPSRQGIISDMTCGSFGKIDKFISAEGLKHTLELHPLVENEEYYIGVFLVGAYQETLGDLHNLLADTNVVTVRVNADGTFDFVHEIKGDSVASILEYVEYDPKRMMEDLRQLSESAVRKGRISPKDRFRIMQAIEDGMRGYTYFER